MDQLMEDLKNAFWPMLFAFVCGFNLYGCVSDRQISSGEKIIISSETYTCQKRELK